MDGAKAGGPADSATLPSLGEPHLDLPPAREWEYKAEGKHNVVMTYAGTAVRWVGLAVRLRKAHTGDATECVPEEHLLFPTHMDEFAKSVMIPLLGKEYVISTPDEWIFWKAQELGFQQHVMFANTSDWRFDTPENNYYVQFIEKATSGHLDEEFYKTHLSGMKALSDKWWSSTVAKFGGAMPVSMVKHWAEVMGLKAGSVRPLAAPEGEQMFRKLSTCIWAARSKSIP